MWWVSSGSILVPPSPEIPANWPTPLLGTMAKNWLLVSEPVVVAECT